MGWFVDLLQLVLQIDVYLAQIVQQFGLWAYGLLGFVIFVETGIVIAPFLPGDSLMFATGAFAARGALDIRALFPLFCLAAIFGDSLNFATGRACRAWINQDKDIRWIRKDHLRRAQAFYAKHGPKMIILARFIPVLRSFAPFVAGVAEMRYATFFVFNVLGGVLWVSIFLFTGYLFGNVPAVKERFAFFIVGIAALSILPLLVEAFQQRRADKRSKA